MKKLISILLAVACLMLSVCALAEETQLPETAGSFDISVITPEGYTLADSTVEAEISITSFEPADVDAKPELCLVIAYSEEYAGVSMTKDMTEEQLNSLYALISEGYESDGYTMGVTDDGWKYMQIMDNEPDNGYATLLMIHDGYFIELFANYTDFRVMTEEDLTDAKALLDSYMIVDMAK